MDTGVALLVDMPKSVRLRRTDGPLGFGGRGPPYDFFAASLRGRLCNRQQCWGLNIMVPAFVGFIMVGIVGKGKEKEKKCGAFSV